jgi:hypothetical protein
MRRLGYLLLAVVGLLAVALGLFGLPSQQRRPERAAEPIRISIPIKNRKLANQAQSSIRVTQGDVLELVFSADEAAHLHLHGYDIHLHVQPGTPAVLGMDAKITGRFPLESHRFGPAGPESATAQEHVVLLHLDVYPR